MSADTIAVLLIIGMAPPATLFPIIYGLTAPWWKTLLGRALMTKATGMALLIDISLIYNFLGDDYYLRDAVRITVFALIFLGTWMQLGALAVERLRARREARHAHS
jgi:hypothetical protein